MTALFEKLSFRQPFRRYQRMILEQVIGKQTDHKYHLVAPPGAGKTIIGLELIRQFDAPAVVFAPTTTIQAQWYEKLGMFLEPSVDVSQFASMDPQAKAPIHIFTYQLISTPAEAQEHISAAARVLWQEELVNEGQSADQEAARARLETIRLNNPDAYHKDLLRFIGRVRHTLLHEPGIDIQPFLHPNARRLIDELVASGVTTVLLDECHHLLDYWAIVLRYLISRIENPNVVGLTATLPSPDGDDEFENYNSLLGEVDFEIPTPAVVKEGDLAPYRDLVYLVKPSRREMQYLNKIQAEFEAAISGLTAQPRFVEWVDSLVRIAPDVPGRQQLWQKRWDERPLLMLAAVRFLNSLGTSRVSGLSTPVEAQHPLELEDWANLLERFGLDVLKISADAQDHALLSELRKAILPFGLTLTERGMSQSRSPGDLVLSFSESKDLAVARILFAESQAMGERLRAIIVTDFERAGTGIRQLKGVLGNDAGSALRLFGLLATHKKVEHLCPMLVTGSMFMIPAAVAPLLLARFSSYLKQERLKATCSAVPTNLSGIVEVVGEGPDWSSRTYVRMATAAFEHGDTKCLIGTRGIFGEGWDSLSLNTLIDLTSVTTSTSVQQLRGRTLRLDPAWPRKVAHNWDVVCVAPQYKRGKNDFERFLSRHNQYWSLVIYSDWLERRDTPRANAQVPPQMHGKVAKGVVHVSPYLVKALLEGKDNFFTSLDIGQHNHDMLNQVRDRDDIYELWGIGEEYSNFSYSATLLNARDLKIKTAFTLQNTLKRLIRNLFASILSVALLGLYYGLRPLLVSLSENWETFPVLLPVFLVLLLIISLVANGRMIFQTASSLFTQQVPDAILLDVGRALLETLRACGLVSRNLSADYVRALKNPDDSYQVLLDYASPKDSSTFIQAYREIFEPVIDQRYLILRTEDRLPNLPLRIIWLPLRIWARGAGRYPSAYHPVPKILAAHKERVETFAKYWERYVGGGKVVFTRNEQGRGILLAARAGRRPKVEQQAFEIWR